MPTCRSPTPSSCSRDLGCSSSSEFTREILYLTFCRTLKDHGIDGTAIGVDTWQGDPQAGYYDGDQILAALRDKHDPEFAAFSTLLRKSFDEALDDVDDGSVDLLHIDGLHTYEAVKHDFGSWLPKLSQRGVILFHDTNVRQADFGVWKLWQEISQTRECYDFPYGNGLGVLVVGSDPGPSVSNLLRILREDYHYSGLPVRELLARIGCGLANGTRVTSLMAEIDRINQDRLGERATAKATIERLRSEQESERAEFKRLRAASPADSLRILMARVAKKYSSVGEGSLGPEIDRLQEAWDSEREATKAELDRLQAELARERRNAKEECARLGVVADELRAEIDALRQQNLGPSTILVERMKGKGRTVLSHTRHAARIAGRNAIEKMPISREFEDPPEIRHPFCGGRLFWRETG